MIQGVLFDLDGTLTEMNIDFEKLREALGAKNTPILEYLESLKHTEKVRGFKILQEAEDVAARSARLNTGALQLLDFLSHKEIKTGIVTRNSRGSVDIVLEKYSLLFDIVVTREDAPPKPSAEPVILASRLLRKEPSQLIFIGDYKFDMLSGRAAGVRTVLLINEKSREFIHLADYTIDSLVEVIDIIKNEKAILY